MDDQADVVLKLSGGPWRLSPWDAKAAYLQLAQVYDPDPPSPREDVPEKGRDVLPLRNAQAPR